MSVFDYFGVVIGGLPTTLALAAFSLLLGSLLGLPLVALVASPYRAVAAPTRLVVDLVRGIPPIVWIFLLYYGLAQDFVQLRPLPAAILGLGLVSGAYMSEVYRSGLLAVDQGQWEAGHALGLPRSRLLFDVIAPQAIRTAIPAAATFALNLLKDTSIASLIGVQEVTFHASREAQRSFDGSLTIFAVTAVVYIAAGLPLAIVSRSLDHRLSAGFLP